MQHFLTSPGGRAETATAPCHSDPQRERAHMAGHAPDGANNDSKIKPRPQIYCAEKPLTSDNNRPFTAARSGALRHPTHSTDQMTAECSPAQWCTNKAAERTGLLGLAFVNTSAWIRPWPTGRFKPPHLSWVSAAGKTHK